MIKRIGFMVVLAVCVVGGVFAQTKKAGGGVEVSIESSNRNTELVDGFTGGRIGFGVETNTGVTGLVDTFSASIQTLEHSPNLTAGLSIDVIKGTEGSFGVLGTLWTRAYQRNNYV